MAHLKQDLKKVKKTRALHRSARLAVPYPTAVIVGYTNAGKSTLLNRLTDADVLVEDKLFATLDPTVRELRLPGGDRVLLADTVGFIRKLPHQLVESFAATFEEIALAEMLLLLVDISHPTAGEHIQATRTVLTEIGVDQSRVLMVLNKADLLADPEQRAQVTRQYPEAVLISAATGEGIEGLLNALSQRLSQGRIHMEVFVPYTERELLGRINKLAKIISSEYEAGGIRMKIETDRKLAFGLREYRI
jgi:GTP-binding protein HflX